jgi:hypothetical protein
MIPPPAFVPSQNGDGTDSLSVNQSHYLEQGVGIGQDSGIKQVVG